MKLQHKFHISFETCISYYIIKLQHIFPIWYEIYVAIFFLIFHFDYNNILNNFYTQFIVEYASDKST